MSAAALLAELRADGVILAADGDKLAIEAARGILTPELMARMRAAKPELMALLAGDLAANDDAEPAQDLPLLAALAEFDALIERLCDLCRFPADVRENMRQARRRMAPGNVPAELDAVREHVRRHEGHATVLGSR